MSAKRKKEYQHFVPQGSLKFFTFDGSHFFEGDVATLTVNPKKKNKGDVCGMHEFYEASKPIANKLGIGEGVLEDLAFATQERLFPKLITKIKKGLPYLLNSQYELMIKAMVMQKYRVNDVRETMAVLMQKNHHEVDKVIKQIQQSDEPIYLLAHLHGLTTDEKMAEMKKDLLNQDKGDFHIMGIFDAWKNQNVAVTNSQIHVANYFDVEVLETADGEYFFTSDNPGFSLKDYLTLFGMQKYLENISYPEINEIYFPITSKMCLHFKRIAKPSLLLVKRDLKYIAIPPKKVRDINNYTIKNKSTKVYCENLDYLRAHFDRLKNGEST